MLPIVIYNGEASWKAPLSLSELLAPMPPKLAKFQLNQEYFLLDENMISEFQLDNAKGEAGYIFRLERARDLESMVALHNEFMSKIPEKKFEFLRRSVRSWLIRLLRKRNLISPDSEEKDTEDNEMLEQKFRRWEQEIRDKGVDEGISLGREEGRAEGLNLGRAEGLNMALANQKTTLLEMISDRFEFVPPSWKEAIDAIEDQAIVGSLIRNVYKAKSQDAFGLLLKKTEQ